MKIDKVLLDINNELTEITAKIADFSMSAFKTDPITSPCGYYYGPPEVHHKNKEPYDGEKADVFATAFILLALKTHTWFGKEEQCKTDYYKYLKKGGPMSGIWPHLRCEAPSEEFQDLFGKMLAEDPAQRISIEEIMAHPWFTKEELPTSQEISDEIQRIMHMVHL